MKMKSRRAGIEELLSRFLSDLDPSDPGASAQRLADLNIKSLIELCLNDNDTERLYEKMSEESYKHSNGFDKISLPRVPSSPIRLRLHIWHPIRHEGSPTPGDAHNHRWPLASRTLVGDLRNDL